MMRSISYIIHVQKFWFYIVRIQIENDTMIIKINIKQIIYTSQCRLKKIPAQVPTLSIKKKRLV